MIYLLLSFEKELLVLELKHRFLKSSLIPDVSFSICGLTARFVMVWAVMSLENKYRGKFLTKRAGQFVINRIIFAVGFANLNIYFWNCHCIFFGSLYWSYQFSRQTHWWIGRWVRCIHSLFSRTGGSHLAHHMAVKSTAASIRFKQRDAGKCEFPS